MSKKRISLIILGVAILALFCANFAYPNYLNQGIDYVNYKLSWQVPHFWEVPFKLGLDLQGGTHLIYEADLSSIAPGNYSTAMDGLRDIISRRVNLFGVREPLVQTEQTGGHYRLIVDLAGIKDPAEAIKLIGQTPFLEFRKQRADADTQKILDIQKQIQGKTQEEVQKIPNWQLGLQDPYFEATDLTGKYLSSAQLSFEPNTEKPIILLQFNDDGAKIFGDLTSANVGKQLAIYIDGTLLSAPKVDEKITGGKAQITGSFTIQEAQSLVKNLNAGALPVPIKLVSQQTIGPSLGASSLQKSLLAGLFGFLAVIIFMLIFYRFPGLIASLALAIYVVLVLAAFKIIGVTLTLAGIGGFILSIGMAVDANILIFSRFREEIKEGKSFGIALEEGFSRSWPAIRDGNLTTIIVALLFFWLGTDFVKGFAFTLIIGILVSMFSAIVITRSFLRAFVGARIVKWKIIW